METLKISSPRRSTPPLPIRRRLPWRKKISQDTLDQIWLLIVKTFAYVLGGATVGLFLIVILDVFYPVELAHVQMMLTIFTTVAGILAGFITGQAVGTAKEKSRAKE